MAFIQTAAALGQRPGIGLSTDNALPERHIVVELLRSAAPLLGLKPAVLATLEAMLSCLAPKRTHHTVFASNATLAFRRNGLSDRTIRRHAALLQEHGLLLRHDSPNKKRYSRHSSADGATLRFGFDLTPLFDRLHHIAQLAAQAEQQRERLAYLRCKLRSAAQDALLRNAEDAVALDRLKALRRKLTIEDCETLLTALEPVPAEGTEDLGQQPALSASDGQFVRHYQRSNKEITERKNAENAAKPERSADPQDLSVSDLVQACPEAAQFAQTPVITTHDVVTHARVLAPMLGIDAASYHAAQDRIGPLGAAVTVWALVQRHDTIRRVGAYFRAITSGAKSDGFDPFSLVRRMLTNAGGVNCAA
jgi:replication initiation protein RepC